MSSVVEALENSSEACASRDEAAGRAKVAYIMSRFPKLTETFISFEILALKKQGLEVEIYPLMRARETRIKVEGASLAKKIAALMSPGNSEVVMHPEVKPLVEDAHFFPLMSRQILSALAYYFSRKPGVLVRTLFTLIRANAGSPNFLLGSLSVFPKLTIVARHMEQAGISHVHAHFANHPAAAAFVIHQLAEIPYSFTAHGADLQVDQHMLREKVRDAEFVAAISQYNADFIVRHCGRDISEKVAVLHCGVDTEVFSSESAKSLVGRPFQIVCTGTFYEVKGHTHLIEACRILKQRGLEFQCDLIGSGPCEQELAHQVEQSGLAEQVRFIGQKNRGEIASRLKQAHVVVVPSIPTSSGRREGIPVVLMEAMASGVAVVASEISGIPELITNERDGLLVPPGAPEAIADAVERLYSDETTRRRFGRKARQTICNRFDLVKNTAELAQRFSQGHTT